MMFGLWIYMIDMFVNGQQNIKYYNSFATVSNAILEGVGYYESKYS